MSKTPTLDNKINRLETLLDNVLALRVEAREIGNIDNVINDLCDTTMTLHKEIKFWKNERNGINEIS